MRKQVEVLKEMGVDEAACTTRCLAPTCSRSSGLLLEKSASGGVGTSGTPAGRSPRAATRGHSCASKEVTAPAGCHARPEAQRRALSNSLIGAVIERRSGFAPPARRHLASHLPPLPGTKTRPSLRVDACFFQRHVIVREGDEDPHGVLECIHVVPGKAAGHRVQSGDSSANPLRASRGPAEAFARPGPFQGRRWAATVERDGALRPRGAAARWSRSGSMISVAIWRACASQPICLRREISAESLPSVNRVWRWQASRASKPSSCVSIGCGCACMIGSGLLVSNIAPSALHRLDVEQGSSQRQKPAPCCQRPCTSAQPEADASANPATRTPQGPARPAACRRQRRHSAGTSCRPVPVPTAKAAIIAAPPKGAGAPAQPPSGPSRAGRRASSAHSRPLQGAA